MLGTGGAEIYVSRLVIAGKPNICYDDSGKSLSRASNACAYTKDEMDGFFLLI